MDGEGYARGGGNKRKVVQVREGEREKHGAEMGNFSYL